MSVSRDEVLHVAKLAELAVPEEEVARLVAQCNRILDYIAHLDAMPAGEPLAEFLPGPATVALREDVEGPVPLARPPASIAPDFADGLFLVPRHGAMEDL